MACTRLNRFGHGHVKLADLRRLWTLLSLGREFEGFFGMLRISAIFIATCMVLIAGSLGFVLYLRFGLTGAESALVALGALTALAVYNAISARMHDRLEASNQLANLARGSGDLARQLAEFSRRLSTVEVKVETVVDRALATAQPLAAEIEELSTLVKQLAELGRGSGGGDQQRGAGNRAPHPPRARRPSGACRSRSLAAGCSHDRRSPRRTGGAGHGSFRGRRADDVGRTAAARAGRPQIPAFAGLDRDGIIAAIRRAIDSARSISICSPS